MQMEITGWCLFTRMHRSIFVRACWYPRSYRQWKQYKPEPIHDVGFEVEGAERRAERSSNGSWRRIGIMGAMGMAAALLNPGALPIFLLAVIVFIVGDVGLIKVP